MGAFFVPLFAFLDTMFGDIFLSSHLTTMCDSRFFFKFLLILSTLDTAECLMTACEVASHDFLDTRSRSLDALFHNARFGGFFRIIGGLPLPFSCLENKPIFPCHKRLDQLLESSFTPASPILQSLRKHMHRLFRASYRSHACGVAVT